MKKRFQRIQAKELVVGDRFAFDIKIKKQQAYEVFAIDYNPFDDEEVRQVLSHKVYEHMLTKPTIKKVKPEDTVIFLRNIYQKSTS